MGTIKQLYTITKTEEKLPEFAKEFIEKHHYSGTARSQLPIATFQLRNKGNNHLRGIALIGRPCGAKVEETYGGKGKVVELRRFVTLDNCKKNTGSYFIANVIKWLQQNTDYTTLVSYADPNHGHTGGLYKACNFKFLGEERSTNPRAVIFKGKQYTMREVYQKLKGRYTPKAQVLQMAIKTKKAKVINLQKKLIYVYNLRKVGKDL